MTDPVSPKPAHPLLDHALIFSAASSAMAFTDAETSRILDVNEAWVRSLGYDREQTLGRTALEMGIWTNPADRAICVEHLRRDGVLRDFVAHLETGHGSAPHVINARVVPMHERNCILWEFRDVTKQMQADALLREREALLNAIVSQAGDGIDLVDVASLRILEVNDAACQMMGYSRAEYLALSLPDTQPDFDEATLRERIAGMIVQGRASIEARHRRKDGSCFDVALNVRAVKLQGRDALVAVWRDISAMKAARQALEDDASWHRALLDNTVDGICTFDDDHRVIEANQRFADMLGYTPAEMIGMRPWDWDVSISEEQIRSQLPTGRLAGYTLETRHRRRDGTEYDAEVTIQYARINGRIIAVTITRDISARKQAEADLRQERHIREVIMESMPGIVYALDSAGRVIFWNKRVEAVTGLPASQIEGVSALNFFRGPDRDIIIQSIGETLSVGQGTAEAELITADGTPIPFYFTGRSIEISGQPVLVGVGIDISEKRRAEEDLRQLNLDLEERVRQRTKGLEYAHRQLRETQFAMDRVGIGIAWANEDTGRFTFANRYYAEFLGYSVEEMLELRVPDIDPNFPEDAFPAVVAEIKARTNLQLETEHLTRDGRRIPVEINVHHRTAEDGSEPLMIAFMSDISRRKEVERALMEARDAAEAANTAKSEFLANMSHEIRTPLNAILGLNYLMRRESPSAAQSERLSKVDIAGRHLVSIINDILDLSKIEAGRLELETSDFHLSAVLDNVASIIREDATHQGLALSIDPDKVPQWLRGDVTRLRQALLNFAGNAVKFTERGHIALRAILLDQSASGLQVRFEVEDTGVGLSAEQQTRLFLPFQQADGSTTRKYGGTGLGLALTKRLVELMGGQVGVTSAPGVGSTFWFTVPLQRGHGPMPDLQTPENNTMEETALLAEHRGTRILLVEDNPINVEVVQQMLLAQGLDVVVAEDGQVALDKARTDHFDLVLMDMQMPRMNGLEATREMRPLPGWKPIPILALTANAFEEDRRACLDAGMNDTLTKPIDPGLLYAALMRWLPAKTGHLLRKDLRAEVAMPPITEASLLDALRLTPGVDLEAGLIAFRGREDRYLRIFGQFMEMNSHKAARIRELVAAGHLEEATRESHSLKGASASLGFQEIRHLATELENLLRQQPLPPDFATEFERRSRHLEIALATLPRLTRAADQA